MRSRIYIVLGTAGLLATSFSGCTSETQRVPELTEQQLKARAQTLAELALQPSAAMRPVPPAPREPDFQFCLLSSSSCMALDPRPFVVCPAAGDPAAESVCDAKGSVIPLDSRQRGVAPTETPPEAVPGK